MAGSSSNIPVSESYSPSDLESLFVDNQFNLWADLSENFPYSFSSLLSNNPLEVNFPTSQPILDVAPSSSRAQETIPVVTSIDMSEAGPSNRPVKRCRNMAELMESTEPVQPRDPAPIPTETTVPILPRDPAPSLAVTTNPLPVLPRDLAPSLAVTTNPFSCGCCHVLREIIHTNGLQYNKLEVHGRIGMIRHAVLHQDVLGGSSRPQIFDFGKKNLGEIKHFLETHCLNQASLGYVMVPDPLSEYYEALCVGLKWTKTPNESLGGSFPIIAEIMSSKGKEPEVETNPQDVYSGLALSEAYRATMEQRKRRDSMTLQDFSNYFHLTLDETSKRLNLSVHAIKVILGKGGLEEWPHKKLQKLMRHLSQLTKRLPHEDPISKILIQGEIRRVQEEMVKLCGGVVPIVAYTTE